MGPSRGLPAGLRLRYALAFAVPLALGVLLRIPSLAEPRWYTDEGIFGAVAQNLRNGQALYSDAWDNKPPLIFFTYAAVQATLGTSVFALHLVATAVVLITLAAVVALGLRLFGPARATAAGLAFAFLLGTPVIEGDLAMTETFMILPATLAVALFVFSHARPEEERTAAYAAAGVLLGVAAAYKQVALLDAVAVAAMIVLTHERPSRAVTAVAAGFAAPQAALAAFFVATGAFGGYWYAIAGSLGLYSGLASQGPFVRATGYLPALLVLGWLVRRRHAGEAVPLAAFPALWLAFAIAGATSSAFPFPHYLQQAAPAASLALVSDPFRWEREQAGRIAVAVAVALVAAIVYGQFAFAYKDRRQLDPVEYYRTYASHQFGTMSDLDYEYSFDGSVITVRDVVRSIDDDGGGRSVYTWSELPWIYAAGGLTNPTRYYTSFLGEVVPGAKQEILLDLDRRPPDYIVISDNTYAPFAALDEFVAERYTLIDEHNDWRLYRRSTTEPGQTRLSSR